MSGAPTQADAAIERFRATYFEECAELVDTVYTHLNDLSEGRGNPESLNAIFRAVHSIKGGGGAFGYDRMVGFAHHFETLLDIIRSDRVPATKDVVSLMTRSIDALCDLISSAKSGDSIPAGFEDELSVALQETAARGESLPTILTQKPTSEPQLNAETQCFDISFRPFPQLYARANEPQLLLRELSRLGDVQVAAKLDAIPDITVLDPDEAYLAWNIRVTGKVTEDRLREVFEFVADDCALDIVQNNAEHPIAIPAAEPPDAPGAPIELSSSEAAKTPAVAPARHDAHSATQSIRVEVERVDRVVNLVGELVINQSMLRQLSSELPPDLCPDLINGLDGLSQHLRELQESVMAMRAQPVKSMFSRMPRLIRELSAQLRKDVRLVVHGEGTEIDKTVIDIKRGRKVYH